MSSAPHTPGPWEAIKAVPFGRYWVQRAQAPHVVVATVWPGDPRQPGNQLPVNANAHLIAAAPELLETARESLALFEILDEIDGWLDVYGDGGTDAKSILAKLCDAIAKAEGMNV